MSCDPCVASQEYEALRREAVEDPGASLRGHGLTLLLTRGMPAWLAALSVFAFGTVPSPPPSSEGVASRPLPQRGALVRTMAEMVLACIKENDDGLRIQ